MVTRRIMTLWLICWLMAGIVAGCGSNKDKEINNMVPFPNRPVTVIVPTTAGSGTDLMVRAMEKAAVRHFDQPLVVTNIAGGSATKGWNELAGAKPDGYTVGVTSVGIILQPLYGPTRYHYLSALDPLVQVVTVPIVAVTRAGQPWNNLDEMVQFATAHPGAIKFGHPGIGSPRHVVGEMFAQAAGIEIGQVPFEGEPEALAALLGGHIQLVFMDAAVAREHIRTGSVKALAVATDQRLPDLVLRPIPTFREQGLDVVFSLWYGIAAPKRLPKDVKDRLADGFAAIIHDAEFQQNLAALGMTVDYLDSRDCGEKWFSDNARLMRIIGETGIAPRVAAQKY